MTKVFIYNLNGVEFFVREEQRGALNEALEAKGQAKCEAEHFDFQGDFEFNVSTQPHKQEKKAYVPNEYTDNDFLALLEQEDPIAYLNKDVIDPGEKVDAEVVNDNEGQEEESNIEIVAGTSAPVEAKEDPFKKLTEQIEKQAKKLQQFKIVDDKEKPQLKGQITKISNSFDTLVQKLQDQITIEFLQTAELLDDLGKDLPQEDIDKIYYVHCEVNEGDTPGKRKGKVVKILNDREKEGFLGEDSKEYKLALEHRIAKYKKQIARFINAAINSKITLAAKKNIATVEKPANDIRTELDSLASYKAEMEKVDQLKANRASEKLRKDRARERVKAMNAVAKAGIVAVIGGCIDETRRKLNQRFDDAVNLAKSEMAKLSQEIEGFNPKRNVEHYQMLIDNVMALLETGDYKQEPVQENTDVNSSASEEEVLENAITQAGGETDINMQQLMKMMMGMSQQMGQTSNGKDPVLSR